MARSSADKLPSVRVVERRPSGDVYRLTCVSLWCWAASASVSGSGVFNPKNWFLNWVIFQNGVWVNTDPPSPGGGRQAWHCIWRQSNKTVSPTCVMLNLVTMNHDWSWFICNSSDSNVFNRLTHGDQWGWASETVGLRSVSGRSPVGRQSDGGSSHCPHLRLF